MDNDNNQPVKQPQTPENKSGEARPPESSGDSEAADSKGMNQIAEAEQQRKETLTERD